jgi:FKBP-type peptidyl-prolyl cis-trans isomerase SlpA
LHYRITLETGPTPGAVFMDTFAQRPATLQMGAGQWAPGLEAALLGRAEGETFSVTLPAAQAYGQRNPELLQWVAHKVVEQYADPGAQLAPGDIVEFVAPNGGRYAGVYKQSEAAGVLFDFNHPLAGADVRLDVELLGVL